MKIIKRTGKLYVELVEIAAPDAATNRYWCDERMRHRFGEGFNKSVHNSPRSFSLDFLMDSWEVLSEGFDTLSGRC